MPSLPTDEQIIHVQQIGWHSEDERSDLKTTVLKSAEEVWQICRGYFSSYEMMQTILNDPIFAMQLKRHGWSDTRSVQRVARSAELDDGFYLYTPQTPSSYRDKLDEIDLEKLSDRDIEDIARENTTILRPIAKSSLKKIHPGAYKKYLAAVRKRNEHLAKLEATRAEREERKKQRRLARLKKELSQLSADKDAGK